jgi:anti-anti-sigma regulatory factor
MNKTGGVMKISGVLDIDAVSALREALLDCNSEIKVDLSEIESCDTSALQLLLASRLSLVELSAAVTETAASLGLTVPSDYAHAA